MPKALCILIKHFARNTNPFYFSLQSFWYSSILKRNKNLLLKLILPISIDLSLKFINSILHRKTHPLSLNCLIRNPAAYFYGELIQYPPYVRIKGNSFRPRSCGVWINQSALQVYQLFSSTSVRDMYLQCGNNCTITETPVYLFVLLLSACKCSCFMREGVPFFRHNFQICEIM